MELDGRFHVLLDPPRSGGKQLLEMDDFMRRVDTCVYVSCNPSTLARDAGILVNRHGFRFVSTCLVDMFPHTNHSECISLFVRS